MLLRRGRFALLRYAPFVTDTRGYNSEARLILPTRRAEEVRWFHTLIQQSVSFAKQVMEDLGNRDAVLAIFRDVTAMCAEIRDSLGWPDVDSALSEAAYEQDALSLLEGGDLSQPSITAAELEPRVQATGNAKRSEDSGDGQGGRNRRIRKRSRFFYNLVRLLACAC